MKRAFLLLITLLLVCGPASAEAYTVYFGVDDTLDLNEINGFGFDLVGVTPQDVDLTVYFQGDNVSVDGQNKGGAVPYLAPGYPWDVFPTATGMSGFDYSFGTFNLSSGVILSMEGQTAFSIDNVIFANNDDPEGKYRLPFVVAERSLDDGMAYTCTVVPIPSTLLLLGGGLVGLVGLKRRNRA